MREVKPDGPHIYKNKVYGARAGVIEVGSERWYRWLEEEEGREFAFRTEAGIWHNARREQGGRRNRGYWYVACRVGRRVQRFYLGPAAALDVERLVAVGVAIAAARERERSEEG
jgi:hypothetical protein